MLKVTAIATPSAHDDGGALPYHRDAVPWAPAPTRAVFEGLDGRPANPRLGIRDRIVARRGIEIVWAGETLSEPDRPSCSEA